MQVSFKYSEFYVNNFAVLGLITTPSTDVTNSLQCKGIFSSNAMCHLMLVANYLSLYLPL